MIYDKQYYLDIFNVGMKDLEDLVATAMGRGGSYADLYFENSVYGDLMLRDGSVASGGFHIDYGVGVRTLCGEKTGYAYSESTQPAAMKATAVSASAIGDGRIRVSGSIAAENGYVPRLYKGRPNPAADRYPIVAPWQKEKPEELAKVLYRLEDKLRAADSRIVKIMAVLSWQNSDILMYNSFAELKYETRPMGTLAVSVILSDGRNIVNPVSNLALGTRYSNC